MANNIVTTLTLIDCFTGPINNAIKAAERSKINILEMGKEVLKSNKIFEEAGKVVEDTLNSPFVKTGKEVFNFASIFTNATSDIRSGFIDKIGEFNTIASFIKNIKELSGVMNSTSKAAGNFSNFKEISNTIIDGTYTMSDASDEVKKLTGTTDKINDTSKSIKGLFGGIKNGSKSSSVLSNLKGRISNLFAPIKKVSNVGALFKDLGKKITGSFSNIKNAGNIGSIFSSFGKKVTDVFNKFKNVNKIGETFKKFGGNISSSFGKLNIVGKLGSVFTKFGSIGRVALMGMTSPAFIVIAVIGAIAIAAFIIIKNWSKIKPFFTSLGKNIARVVTGIKPIIEGIKKFFKPILTFLASVFIAKFTTPFRFIGNIIRMYINLIVSYISGMLKIFDGIITFFSGVFSGNLDKVLQGIVTIFKGIFESIGAIVKVPFNNLIVLLNTAIGGINKLKISLPDWLGGKSFSFNIPTIPMLAKGTNYWQGGTAMIHDRGAEIVDLPRGSRVYPHDKSIQMARSEGAKGKSNIAISIAKLADKIEVRSDKDIDDIVNKVADKFERILNNTGEVVPG